MFPTSLESALTHHSTPHSLALVSSSRNTHVFRIVTTEPVVKPHALRLNMGESLSLRRRRGLMPLKIVHPEAILRAVFAPHRVHGAAATRPNGGVDLSADHYM